MTGPDAADPPPAMGHTERERFKAAAHRVTLLYPGAAGEILAAELRWWAQFGYRLGPSSTVRHLADEVLTAPLPPTADPDGDPRQRVYLTLGPPGTWLRRRPAR